MYSHLLALFALTTSLVPLITCTSHPLMPANFSHSNYLQLLPRQLCPTTQICGESCCLPPAVCNPGAFYWCQNPDIEEERTCEAGKALCSDGVSCCRIGYTCDFEARTCWAPTTASRSEASSSSTSSGKLEEETKSSSNEQLSSFTSTASSTSASTTGTTPLAPVTSQTSASAATSPTPTGGSTKISSSRWEVLAMGVLLACFARL